MIIKSLYQFAIVGDESYEYITAIETNYESSTGTKGVKGWMRSKFVKELLKQGIIVDKIEELC